ncbi:MAG: hypothetical protein KME50_12255 [Nostoc desertorum CM1-VF14]|nr:hypothetical protein [Nostoc desertorum CM1-VF14]
MKLTIALIKPALFQSALARVTPNNTIKANINEKQSEICLGSLIRVVVKAITHTAGTKAKWNRFSSEKRIVVAIIRE